VQGFDDSLTLTGLRTLALVYQSQGKFAQAEALLSKVLETMRRIREPRQLSIATIFVDLAFADQSQGKYEQAEALLREGLAISDTKTPQNWDSFRCRSVLGASLAGQKRYAESEPLLVEGYEGMRQRESAIPAFFRFHLLYAAEQLAQLSRAIGKPDQAAEWDSVAKTRKTAISK
jgi:tetratricopeptide (TPR) repeat protein